MAGDPQSITEYRQLADDSPTDMPGWGRGRAERGHAEIARGMVKTDSSLVRFGGDRQKADAVYAEVAAFSRHGLRERRRSMDGEWAAVYLDSL